MKPKQNVKKIIKSKINYTQKKAVKSDKPVLKQKLDPVKKQILKMEEYRDIAPRPHSSQERAFVSGNPNFKDVVGYDETQRLRFIEAYRAKYELVKSTGYQKEVKVDYDVIICISSHNRYDKVVRLIDQFNNQLSKYTFKIVFLDDASTDERYTQIKTKYSKLDYHVNTKNNGRNLYWYTVTQLWLYTKPYSSNTILMIDDDFILCDNFLNVINDFFFHIKNDNNTVIGIAPHLHSYSENFRFREWWYNQYSVDGICLFDRKFIESFDYRLQPVSQDQLNTEHHAHGWSQIQKKILTENKFVYKTRYSIAFHDGNDGSMLGKDNKRKSNAYTHYYRDINVNYLDLIV